MISHDDTTRLAFVKESARIGGIGGPGAGAPGLGLGGALPNAGAPATLWLMIPLGLAFLLAGAAAMRMGRRPST